MERIAMSQQERDELDWLRRAKEGSISQREAAQKMGVSDRWVRKQLKRMIKRGDAVVVHGLRGRPSKSQAAGRDSTTSGEAFEATGLARAAQHSPAGSWPNGTGSKSATRPGGSG